MANLDSNAGGRVSTSTACPACGALRTGKSHYCEECGRPLPAAVATSVRRQILLAACTLAWIVGVVLLLIWLTGHALLMK